MSLFGHIYNNIKIALVQEKILYIYFSSQRLKIKDQFGYLTPLVFFEKGIV